MIEIFKDFFNEDLMNYVRDDVWFVILKIIFCNGMEDVLFSNFKIIFNFLKEGKDVLYVILE